MICIIIFLISTLPYLIKSIKYFIRVLKPIIDSIKESEKFKLFALVVNVTVFISKLFTFFSIIIKIITSLK